MPSLGDLPLPKFISLFFSGRANYVHAAPRVEHPDDPVPASETPRTFDVIGSEDTDPDFINLQVCPEAWRFVAYFFFWTMCGLAITLNNTLVAPILLRGSPDGSSCPPFETGGKGFDVHTNSHLNRLFGFNNICVNWDYFPSRELTALYYPAFEYCLLVYLSLDFLTAAISYKKGYVGRKFWTISCVLFPIQVVLCAWFRMIFVVRAYENVRGHTAGFLGLQFALAFVAVQNVYYVVETKVFYSFLGGLNGTRIAARTYLYSNLLVSSIKLYLTIYVVSFGIYPEWAKGPSVMPGRNWGQFVDMFWMLFNAILPVIISFFRARTEKPLEIRIGLPAPKKISDPTIADPVS